MFGDFGATMPHPNTPTLAATKTPPGVSLPSRLPFVQAAHHRGGTLNCRMERGGSVPACPCTGRFPFHEPAPAKRSPVSKYTITFACHAAALWLIVGSQPPYPNVSIAHKRVVILQRERFFGVVRGIECDLLMLDAAQDLLSIVNEYPVMKDGDECRFYQFA